jgi:sugar-specific transcriptional regulator TrmB
MSMAETMDALEAIGLTRTEAKLYLFLLQHGSSPQGEITKGVQLHRRTVYDVLARLVEKGIISSITKNNRLYYEAVRPERFREMLHEREAALGTVLPKLDAMFSAQQAKEGIKIFSGKHGLKAMFDDQIEEGKPILILGASPLAHSMMKYYFKAFDRRRAEKKIKAKIVLDVSAREKFRGQRIPLAEMRYIPEEIGSVASTNIYGDKVAIIIWNELTPVAVLIESKPIADSYRKFFEVVWEKARANPARKAKYEPQF